MTHIDDLLSLPSAKLTEDAVMALVDSRAQMHDEAPKAEGGSMKALAAEVDMLIKKLEDAEGCFDTDLISSLKKMFGAEMVRNKALIENRKNRFIRNMPDVGVRDTMSDIAGVLFVLVMRDRRDLALAGLNRYLKKTDDFSGLRLAYFYGALHALHKALELTHACSIEKQDKRRKDFEAQATNAAEYALVFLSQQSGKRVVAIGGLSGAGKTTLGRALSPKFLAIHVRSDAVRKHLFGYSVEKKAPLEAYSTEHSEKTYRGLEERLGYVLDAGFNAIIDGVFADEGDRDSLENICHHKSVSFTGIWCSVPADIAQKRIISRMHDRSEEGKGYDTDMLHHEKQLLLNPGRITWHRLDTLYGVEQLVDRCSSLLELSA